MGAEQQSAGTGAWPTLRGVAVGSTLTRLWAAECGGFAAHDLAVDPFFLVVFRLGVVFRLPAVVPADVDDERLRVVIYRRRLSNSDVVHATDLFNLSF